MTEKTIHVNSKAAIRGIVNQQGRLSPPFSLLHVNDKRMGYDLVFTDADRKSPKKPISQADFIKLLAEERGFTVSANTGQ